MSLYMYIDTCIYNPSLSSLSPLPTIPPLWAIRERQAGLPVPHSSFSPAACFAYGSVHRLVLLSPLTPPSPFPTMPTSLFSMSVISIPSLQLGSSVLFFQIPYICFNVLYLFFLTYFTLSNRLQVHLPYYN